MVMIIYITETIYKLNPNQINRNNFIRNKEGKNINISIYTNKIILVQNLKSNKYWAYNRYNKINGFFVSIESI